MQKRENKKSKQNILSFHQNRLLKESLKKLFGQGLTENQKLAAPVRDYKTLRVMRFLQEDF